MDTDPLPDSTESDVHDYRTISHARDGSVREVRSLLARSDAEAIAQADALAREFAMDLWDGLRFVEHFVGRHILTGCLLTTAGMIAGGR